MKIGERYYFISIHAYDHWLGEVIEILGQRHVVLKNVVRVYSCPRGWTEFFRDGMKKDTNYTVWPDGHEVFFSSATPWHHPIPKEQK